MKRENIEFWRQFAGQRVYIAGPMTGIELWNFPAFDEVERKLREIGVLPVSPAALDRAYGAHPEDWKGSWSQTPEHFNIHAVAKRDITGISEAKAIAVLEGYSNSKGTFSEVSYGEWVGVPAYEFSTGERVCVKREFYCGTENQK